MVEQGGRGVNRSRHCREWVREWVCTSAGGAGEFPREGDTWAVSLMPSRLTLWGGETGGHPSRGTPAGSLGCERGVCGSPTSSGGRVQGWGGRRLEGRCQRALHQTGDSAAERDRTQWQPGPASYSRGMNTLCIHFNPDIALWRVQLFSRPSDTVLLKVPQTGSLHLCSSSHIIICLEYSYSILRTFLFPFSRLSLCLTPATYNCPIFVP